MCQQGIQTLFQPGDLVFQRFHARNQIIIAAVMSVAA
jgi:hypothetical protein